MGGRSVCLDHPDELQNLGLDYSSFLWLAPLAEARFKSISTYLAEVRIPQVLELGSGFSTRFLTCAGFGAEIFFDTDLPHLMKTKREVLASTQLTKPMPEYAMFLDLDVSNEDNWVTILGKVKASVPLAIVNEGLFQYFARNDLKKVAMIIRDVLKRTGGTWISPDFSTHAQYSRYYEFSHSIKQVSEARQKLTGRKIIDNAFANCDEITRFFGDLGFRMERRNLFSKADTLSSVEKLGLNGRQIVDFFDPYFNLWILTAS